MYLLFNKNLIDVMGEDARKDFYTVGLEISPKYQYTTSEGIKTIAKVLDQNKAVKYFNHPDCQQLTKDEANVKINEFHKFTYTVTNQALYSADLNKKIIDGTIRTDNIAPSWTLDQELEYFYDNGILGITKSNTPEYVTE